MKKYEDFAKIIEKQVNTEIDMIRTTSELMAKAGNKQDLLNDLREGKVLEQNWLRSKLLLV